jgi:ribosome recycling factor
MSDEILLEAEDRMQKAVHAYESQLNSVRTGRANPALVDHLQVEHYGQAMPLNQLATIAAPEAQLITVQPWDKGAVNSIMKAIQASDIGITPSSDGAIIRLPIPALTEERRRDMVKQVHSKTEDARISIRSGRRYAMDELKKAVRTGDISEDDERRAQGDVEKLTARYVEQIEALAKRKEQELLAV